MAKIKSFEVIDLVKDFKYKKSWFSKPEMRQVLKKVSFKINGGCFHGFIGPNGCGKTTTIQSILGIITKTNGIIKLNGEQISQKNINSIVGYIPHEIVFPKHLKSLDFILEMAKLHGIKTWKKKLDLQKEINKLEQMTEINLKKAYLKLLEDKRIEQNKKLLKKIVNPKYSLKENYLNVVRFLFNIDEANSYKNIIISLFKKYGIEEALYINPNECSSGMKKKILLIHSLLNDAKLMILDEPAANLDPDARIDLFKTLKEINEEKKVTIFICSHILKELEGLVDEVTIMTKGTIRYTGLVKKKQDLTKLYQEVTGKKYVMDESEQDLKENKKKTKRKSQTLNEQLEKVKKTLKSDVTVE